MKQVQSHSKMNNRSACILQVEDDETDVLLLRHAFEEAQIFNPVRIACDGQQAIDYLNRAGREATSRADPMPCFVLLDLNLPVKSGLDVLKWIRQQPWLNGLPVIVLTSSDDPKDIALAYQLGANSYAVKPFNEEVRRRLAHGLKLFWIECNRRPELAFSERAEGA